MCKTYACIHSQYFCAAKLGYEWDFCSQFSAAKRTALANSALDTAENTDLGREA